MSTRNLNHLFDELNRRLWRGRLPKYRVIRTATFTPLPASGRRLLGKCDDHARMILIRPQTPKGEHQTLVHEMCHIGMVGPRHGSLFRRRLARAARRLHDPLLFREIIAYQDHDAAHDRAVTARFAEGRARLCPQGTL